MTQCRVPLTAVLALLVIAALAPTAGAQIKVSGNDNKVLLVNGVVTVVANPPSDTVSVIDLNASPPYWVFSWDGTTLKDTGGRVKVHGGAAAVRTAEK
jgi:hypothetical protein